MIQILEATTVATSAPIVCVAGDTPVFTGSDVPIKALFEHLASDQELRSFSDDSPSVSYDHAVRAVEMARAMLEMYAFGDVSVLDELCGGESVITRDKGMIWGTPAFRGTRMPMDNLFDHLVRGYNISGFLSRFDTSVTREQAKKAIRMGGRALEDYAYANSTR